MGMEWPTAIYRLLPGYHMLNIGSWMERGHALSIKMAAVTLGVFRRQDIN